MGKVLKSAVMSAALSLVIAGQPLVAQSGSETAGAIASVINALGQASAQSRFKKDIASMSSPLVYESSNGPLDPANMADPRNFDIAGIRLGMTLAEVKKALVAAGYTVNHLGDQNSFDTEVRKGASLKGDFTWVNVARYLKADGKNQQDISVEFIALPEGPRVLRIEYGMGSADMSSDAFKAQIFRKYGDSAIVDGGSSLKWCAADEECSPLTTHAYMEVDLDAKSIKLEDRDEARDTALAERIQFEIAKRRPNVEEAQF